MPKQVLTADPAKTIFSGPLVVLTNRGTLGGAEVAAAALVDNKRAQVVGERTFGDAAMRKAVPTEDGGAVLLAVAKYYSPNGKAIQDTPITPTFLVNDVDTDGAADEEDPDAPPQKATPATTKKPGEDAILKKALDVLNGTVHAEGAKPAEAPVPAKHP